VWMWVARWEPREKRLGVGVVVVVIEAILAE
jgi:hypothetical protein